MKINKIIAQEMSYSTGQVKVVKVPTSKKITEESLKKLDREIAALVSANEAMSTRSMFYASKMSAR